MIMMDIKHHETIEATGSNQSKYPTFSQKTFPHSWIPCKKKLRISSHNLESHSILIEHYHHLLTRKGGENDIILLQDLGREAEHTLFRLNKLSQSMNYILNQSPTNSSRSVAIMVGKNWNVLDTFSNCNGGAVGLLLNRGELLLASFSVYLPSGLDNLSSQSLSKGPSDKSKSEATNTYKFLEDCILSLSPWVLWIVGGDCNETRSSYDRLTIHGTNLKKG